MDKFDFDEFRQVMACNLHKKSDPCIEIWFNVDACTKYQESWMGKDIDKDTGKDVYWFGLLPDMSQSYAYETFEAFANAKVFYSEKSLKEIWDSISIISLDGGHVEETLPYFLNIAG